MAMRFNIPLTKPFTAEVMKYINELVDDNVVDGEK